MKRVLDVIAAVLSIVKRQQSYVALLNFIMIYTMYKHLQELKWWYFVVLAGIVVFAWFDDRYMRGRDEDYARNKSKLFKHMTTELKEIRSDLQYIKAAKERESSVHKTNNAMQLELRLLHSEADDRQGSTVHGDELRRVERTA